mgnify:CR=1 FL=1
MKLFKSVFGAILVVSFLQIGYSCSSDFQAHPTNPVE